MPEFESRLDNIDILGNIGNTDDAPNHCSNSFAFLVAKIYSY